jgi:hypothetical protein
MHSNIAVFMDFMHHLIFLNKTTTFWNVAVFCSSCKNSYFVGCVRSVYSGLRLVSSLNIVVMFYSVE